MLLCSVSDLTPGMVIGAPVIHPRRANTDLLRPGAPVTLSTIRRLRDLDVTEVWIRDGFNDGPDPKAVQRLAESRRAVYHRLTDDFGRISSATVTEAQVGQYRQAITALLTELAANGQYAHLSTLMCENSERLFTHGANVAFLSLILGLEMRDDIVRERRLAPTWQARDLVPLGLGAMLHDIGKLSIDGRYRDVHEVHLEAHEPDDVRSVTREQEYRRHVFDGYRALASTHMPATSRHIVLSHHQRYDGKGWPDLTRMTHGRLKGAPAGSSIHIFSRIVAAANVLDGLMADAEGNARPAVAALSDFASPRFEGWFDPKVRDLMLRRVPPFAIGSLVRLSDGRQAAVLAPNLDQPCRPTVRPVRDLDRGGAGGVERAEPIPLIDHPELHITECGGHRVTEHLFTLPARVKKRRSA